MKKCGLQNERLDEIGRKLLKSRKLQNEEVEKIVSKPQLFNSVMSQIKTEQLRRERKIFFGQWFIFQNWHWQKTALSFGILAAFLVTAMSFGVFKNSAPSEGLLTGKVITPEIQMPTLSTENLSSPQIDKVMPESQNTIDFGAKHRKVTQKIRIKNHNPKLRKSSQKTNLRKPLPQSTIDEGEFFPLIFAGNPTDEDNTQIIRADLSRATLFALGVNLSLENENETIKTDILFGSDGLPKAIRLVN